MSFSSLWVHEEKQNKAVAKLICRGLSKKEQLEGFIYVAEQNGGNYCKVGYAKKDAARRIKAIGKCEIVTSNSYQIGSFVGAYRAEQLIHKLLSHCRRIRYNCPCGCKNRERYEIDFERVKVQVLIVHSWFRANPYGRFPKPDGDTKVDGDAKPKELEKVWQDALKRWKSTQEGPKPLKWDAFFINGPTMLTVMSSSCQTPPPKGAPSGHASSAKRPNHLPGSGRKPVKLKNLLKHGLMRAMTGMSRHDGDSANGFHFPNVRRGSSGQTTSNLSRQAEAEEEAQDTTPSKYPQTRRQYTWDYWFDAEANPASNIMLSGTRTNLQQSATTNSLQESPPVSFLDDPAGIARASSVKCGQEHLPLSMSEHGIGKSSSFLEMDDANASHCFQGTSAPSKSRSPGVKAEAVNDVAPQAGALSRDNDEMTEIAARLAKMPGVFPHEESEESSLEVLAFNEIPRSPTHMKNSSSPADAYLQEPLSGGAGERVSRTSIDHGDLQNSCSNVAQNMDESAPKTTLSEGEVPTKVAPVSTTACEEMQREKTTKTVLLDSNCEAEPASIAASQGTAELPSQFFEKSGDSIIYECKSTNYRPPYCRSEESRPANDGAEFRIGCKKTSEPDEEPPAEEESAEDGFSEESSEWDTVSSLSDDDRPYIRQRKLGKELIGLCEEHNYYTYHVDVDTLQWHEMGRIKKLRQELKTMDLGTAEEESLEGEEWYEEDDDGSEEDEEDDDEEDKDEEDDGEGEDEVEEEEKDEPSFPTKNWADEPSDDDPADLDWSSDEDFDSRHGTQSGEGECLFDEDGNDGQATSEVLHHDKNLLSEGRLPRPANRLPTPINREPVSIGLRIADRPHYPASAYTERITFRMKERVWGDPHNPVKITFSDSRILGAFNFSYQH